MKRPRPRRPAVDRLSLTAQHEEALTVAMVLAPGVYVRNRMFDFFTDAGVQRARTRASTLRGIIPQLARATTLSLTTEQRGSDAIHVLRYRIASLRLSRVVELTRTELATVRVAAERKKIVGLPAEDEDRSLVERALGRLLDLGPELVEKAASSVRAAALPDESS
jgi:hypothetical protein